MISKEALIEKVVQFVRDIQDEFEVEPERIYAIRVWSSQDRSNSERPMTYRVRVGLDNLMYLWCMDEYSPSDQKYANYVTLLYMEDDGLDGYEFAVQSPSISGTQKFTLKKKDVFKEEE